MKATAHIIIFQTEFSHIVFYIIGTYKTQIVSDLLNPEHECPPAIRTKDNAEIEDGGLGK